MSVQIQAARGVTIRRVTSGPASHFFGYYDMPSWDVSGRFLLIYCRQRKCHFPFLSSDLQ